MSEANLFEKAIRGRFRFPSIRGDLTAEQLFDLPLTSKNGFDLDTVAKGINAELKEAGEESFVETSARNTRRDQLADQLEFVKLVIADKQAEAAKIRAAADRRQKRAQILDALARRENEELNSASKEDLLKQLAELDG